MSRNYWGYRIDKTKIDFFRQELAEGKLRQGWGWDDEQNLRQLTMDSGARRNLPIFRKVKKGDILLVPRLPTWNEVAIVEATQDFDEGYDFFIHPELEDFGHIFPARLIKSFNRTNTNVLGDLRASLKQVNRFWNMSHCKDSIEALINHDELLIDSIGFSNRFNNLLTDNISKSLEQTNFYNSFYQQMNKQFSNEEWEYALVEGIRKILPEPILVERTGGPAEKDHGTDILITLPGLLGKSYGIAIQVKDYRGLMSDGAIKQIQKADYWNNENFTVIDKYVIVTCCLEDDHPEEDFKDIDGVTVLFAEQLESLLKDITTGFIGLDRN
ncbi:hypothetical protein UA38_04950 [Photobacterium kishitanii]|uniref:Restriction endonuclease type IV Mrr domain-containing protein n=1 Tax=Photobacterium kishitanii TaxID=318456 RepID=A0AAX0YUI1_9GAMM|nr:hypothetical protein [Photobacterium kishitanii]KJG11613.1 hypothetical protein UB40_03120 [Photobacterium kishitanii]KJG59078.1 hypothetical protein UA38_04950 [Photobacterium kishitanii]KJG61996.1 hypothetical protein UA42_06180 [Photobacterium kishitanii]KJG67269.1 hypothetical protein UA40_04960 [Photobacterium kishitanii]KJG70487.1 hypothetical protein UA41_04450 [Photobacterium kishitanii]